MVGPYLTPEAGKQTSRTSAAEPAFGFGHPSQQEELARLPFQAAGTGLTDAQRQSILSMFRCHRTLRNWPETAFNALCDAGYLRTYTDGEVVFHEDEACNDIQLVLSGHIEMSWTGFPDVWAVSTYIPPGEVINIVSVVDGKKSMHHQRARGTTQLFHIPGQALLAQLQHDAQLALSILELICARSRKLHLRLGKSTVLTLRSRLADHLLSLTHQLGETNADGTSLNIRVSQEDLAALLSAARSSVNKELRWMVEQGIIRIGYRSITVLDPAALRAVMH